MKLQQSTYILLLLLLQKNINTSYERYKIIAFSDLRMDADSVEMSPKLVSIEMRPSFFNT